MRRSASHRRRRLSRKSIAERRATSGAAGSATSARARSNSTGYAVSANDGPEQCCGVFLPTFMKGGSASRSSQSPPPCSDRGNLSNLKNLRNLRNPSADRKTGGGKCGKSADQGRQGKAGDNGPPCHKNFTHYPSIGNPIFRLCAAKAYCPMSPLIDPDADTPRRQRWLSLLAKAPAARLEALWQGLGPVPAYSVLRRPEIGLVMVQGRISGSGGAFCAGEMTATRTAVRLESGEIGFGYVGGRHPRQAEIVAAIDALGQRSDWQRPLEDKVVAPLAHEADARRQLTKARAAATKVDFFTVAREAGT